MITIRDVAKKSGFSPTTVSLVLNNAPRSVYIPAKTKTIIHRVAKELSYTPNIFARSLRAQRTDTIGIVVFDITDPYCTQILRGIETELNEAAFLYLLSDVQNDRERFQKSLALLFKRKVEGLILIANSLAMSPSILKSIQAPHVPVVVIGRQPEGDNGSSSVAVNNDLGGYLAIKHLYELGHRHIAFLRGPKSIVDSVERWKGIERFAKAVRLPIKPELTIDLKASAMTSMAGKSMVESLLRAKRKFTAVLAFDDMTAAGAIRALSEAGLDVPRDCSVIGFDDIDAAGFYNPPLTTIRQPMSVMGQEGAAIVLEKIKSIRSKKKPSHEVHRLLEPELVVRNTTIAIKMEDGTS